jgi:predicted CoA-binding protein
VSVARWLFSTYDKQESAVEAPRRYGKEVLVLTSDQEIRELLTAARTIAVVGISDDPERDSYMVAEFLQRQGYRIIPVNPRLVNLNIQVLGEKAYATLRDVPEKIDIVDIFRRPETVMPVVEDAIAAGAGAVWMQLSIVNEEAAARAEAAGLNVVMNRCMAVEYRRLMSMTRRSTCGCRGGRSGCFRGSTTSSSGVRSFSMRQRSSVGLCAVMVAIRRGASISV